MQRVGNRERDWFASSSSQAANSESETVRQKATEAMASTTTYTYSNGCVCIMYLTDADLRAKPQCVGQQQQVCGQCIGWQWQ